MGDKQSVSQKSRKPVEDAQDDQKIITKSGSLEPKY